MKAQIQDWKNPELSHAAIYSERADRLRAIRRGGPRALAAAMRYYQDHPVEWIEDWTFTLDPRKVSRGLDPFVPFMLFPAQRDLIDWIHARDKGGETGVLEKSRDTGISWCCAAYGCWSWINRPGSAVGFGSYERDKVDKRGVPDSTLEKCRIIIRKLPKEFLPENFADDKDLLFMRLVNRENGATIVGECGDNIGRGARATIFFVDEAAHLAHPEQVDAGLAATSDCKIYASTAHGMGAFYRKVKSGHYPVFRFHWTKDPRKDEEWYAEQERTLDPVIRAQEVDIDHTASIEGIILDPKNVEASKKLRRMLGPAEALAGVAGVDVGGGGTGLSVFLARFGPGVRSPEIRRDGDTTGTALWARDCLAASGARVMNYDSIGVGEGVTSTLTHSKDVVVREHIPEEVREKTDQERIEDAVNEAAGADAVEIPSGLANVTAKIYGVNVGVPASEFVRWPDGQTSNQKFANLKAELWWTCRDRLQKTFEHWCYLTGRDGGKLYPVDELLLLPDDDTLASQLSTPTWHKTAAGKIQVESKEQLSRRGVASPDYAEALMLTFVPTTPGMRVKRIKGAY